LKHYTTFFGVIYNSSDVFPYDFDKGYAAAMQLRRKKFYNIRPRLERIPRDKHSGATLLNRLLAIPTNIRQDWKGLPRANTLAYYEPGRKKVLWHLYLDEAEGEEGGEEDGDEAHGADHVFVVDWNWNFWRNEKKGKNHFLKS
jgi:hypothetical protein